MRNIQKLVAVLALSGLCLAAPVPSGSDAPKKDKQKKEASSEQLKELKQAIEQQQAATQQLQQQLQQTQQQLQQTQQQLLQTQAAANAANAKASAVESSTGVEVKKVEADLSDVQTALKTNAAETKKALGAFEHPNFIAFKGVRLIPGGFIDMTAVERTHATNSGPATLFNGIPLENAQTGVGNLSEFSESARASRFTLRADTEIGTTKMAGFFEGDFYGLTIATPNQTSAWGFRVRQAWARAQYANGWSVTFGQQWNLITMNRRAADSDATWIPNVLDTNYIAGWEWGRQAELRIAKKLNKQTTFAVALTDPSYLNLGATNVNGQVAGLAVGGGGNLGNSPVSGCTSGSTSTTTPVGVTTYCTLMDTYSTNLAPDMIAKLAYDDAKYGHFEVKGIARFFRDRKVGTTVATSWDNTGLGGGVGGGAIIPVVKKKVDFVFQGLWGKGISRYQDSGQYDFVVKTNGLLAADSKTLTTTGADNNLVDIKSFSAAAGFETHPTPKWEVDLYSGGEYYYRTVYNAYALSNYSTSVPAGTLLYLGYGSKYGTAGANNRAILDNTIAAYYTAFSGPHGKLLYGAQYAYVIRTTWSGDGKSGVYSAVPGTNPKGLDSVFHLGIRYVLP